MNFGQIYITFAPKSGACVPYGVHKPATIRTKTTIHINPSTNMNKAILTTILTTFVLACAGAQVPANVQAVDLGLPSGLYWASCNVGAATPEGYGDYFAWGETEAKTDYSWTTYKYANGSHETLAKYCNDTSYGNNGFTDNKTTLDPEDDAATANWGGAWRMPTDAEWTELREQCMWTWTTQNGINGYQVTSKTNSNSIFLPAAGYRYNETLSDGGSYGNYWASSLFEKYSGHAWGIGFYSGLADMGSYTRCYGQSVRPVQGTTSGTGIINPSITTTSTSRKVLHNGQLIIVRDGVCYDTHGRILPPNL